MPEQFSARADFRLNKMEELLGDEKPCPTCGVPTGIVPAQKHLEALHSEAWKTVFGEFDANGLAEKPARFIANDGYVLSRQITSPDERLDETLLLGMLYDAMGTNEADKLWKSITDAEMKRTLNQGKLAKALKAGKLPAALVSKSMVKPASQIRRVRLKATAEDKAFVKGNAAVTPASLKDMMTG